MVYVSKTQQIVDIVTEKISTGQWLEGDSLPSQAMWREEYGFTYGTLRGALLILKTRGLIEGRQGVGIFVAKSNISMTAEEFNQKQKKAK